MYFKMFRTYQAILDVSKFHESLPQLHHRVCCRGGHVLETNT